MKNCPVCDKAHTLEEYQYECIEALAGLLMMISFCPKHAKALQAIIEAKEKREIEQTVA